MLELIQDNWFGNGRGSRFHYSTMNEDSCCIDGNDSVCRQIHFDDEAETSPHATDNRQYFVKLKANPKQLRNFALLKLYAENRQRNSILGVNSNSRTTFTEREIDDTVEYIKTSTLEELKRDIHRRNEDMARKSKRKAATEEVTELEENDHQLLVPTSGWSGDENENIAFGASDEMEDESAVKPAASVNVPVPTHLLTRDDSSDESSPTCVSNVTNLSGLSKEELIEILISKDKLIDEKESEIAVLKCGKKKAKVAMTLPKAKTPLDGRLLKEMSRVLKEEVIQWLHMQPKHWEGYSDHKEAMCNIIMSHMQGWPVNADGEFKKETWNRLLGPNLNRRWSVVKNEVLQRMRSLYLSELLCSKLQTYTFCVLTLRMFCITHTVEMNTPHEIKVKDLNDILDTSPDTLLQESSPLLGKLADFVLRYVILIGGRETILQQVKASQLEVHQDDAQRQRKNNFQCVLCHIHPPAVAYVWMQFDNHSDEWSQRKMMGPASASKDKVKDLQVPKYTSVKGGRKNGGSCISSDGKLLYDRVERFVEQFTGHESYDVFQRACNRKAKDYGLLEEIMDTKMPALPMATPVAAQDDGVQTVCVPTFTVGKRIMKQCGV